MGLRDDEGDSELRELGEVDEELLPPLLLLLLLLLLDIEMPDEADEEDDDDDGRFDVGDAAEFISDDDETGELTADDEGDELPEW